MLILLPEHESVLLIAISDISPLAQKALSSVCSFSVFQPDPPLKVWRRLNFSVFEEEVISADSR